MKVSTKTTYGIRFMLSLALEYNKNYIRLRDVAETENISEKYMESIVAAIKPLGIIEVKRGAKGGYKLSKHPQEISLKEIFEILEGAFINLEATMNSKNSQTYNEQVVNDFWHLLKMRIDSFLEKKTLADLVDDFNKKGENNMFFI